ncbi:ABC transporter substrate-binding protein [Paenibacillus soyae]|uniref:Extracellular solute-binding protein n=1 Tax=Paenibacillus soyae TaxID=2969249 RepID=A0A9X2SC27_9BACL|nr:extracellular solute-binding protein [Paenibacillus soyae]MCR2806288.1 extracellular solute-binding protein [Paenibacillus soyae]
MVMRRRIAYLAAAAFLAIVLSACSSGNDTIPTRPQDGESVKLRIMWWGAQSRHEVTLRALEAYTKANPHVTFEPEYSGMDGYLDKLSTQAAAQNAPDIFQIDPSWVADWASRNQLIDMTDAIDLTNIDAKLTSIGYIDNKLYGVPLGSVAHGMIYDKAAMEKLGLSVPSMGWTWDEFFQYAVDAKVKLGGNQYLTKDYAGDYFAYSAYQYAHGKGQLITNDGKFNVDRTTFLDWAMRWQTLREDGVIPPADVNASDKEFDPAADLLVKGNILIRLAFNSSFGAWDSMNPGAYALVTMPRAEEAGGWLKPSLFFGISPFSKNAEEAKKFVNWFINSQEAGEILGTSRGVPVNAKVAAAIESSLSDADRAGMELYNATQKHGQQWSPGASGWTNWVDKDWSLVRDELSFGKKTPEQAFDALQKLAKEYGK